MKKRRALLTVLGISVQKLGFDIFSQTRLGR